ncbi:MAG: DEAD/DEAH box helicase [Treponema sp.]|jgi:superfamily II DNA/RNA helicase|nr:DEAD/DEAH box helicase [Treponema sp.]
MKRSFMQAPDDFVSLGIEAGLAERLPERGIKKPSEIQKQVIPLILEGKDLFFSSATGTGKTFAYLLPILQRLKGREPSVLLLAPTYELCAQIKNETDFLLKTNSVSPSPHSSLLLIGSGNISRQIDSLKKNKPEVIAGNPGRVLLLAKMKKLSLKALSFLVLDEADRLVSDESLAETRELLELIGRETGVPPPVAGPVVRPVYISCSATITDKCRQRLLPFFRPDHAVVSLSNEDVLRERIEHWAFFAERRHKISSLRSFLAAVKPGKALVFSGGAGQPGNVVSQLQYHHINALPLFAGMDKKSRKAAIDGFRGGKVDVLVSSDLACRGLDINGVTHIIALDCPGEDLVYIHRAGRTARAGRRGIMVTIGDEQEMNALARLEKRLGITVYPKILFRGKVAAAGST